MPIFSEFTYMSDLLSHSGSNDAGSPKDVPLGVLLSGYLTALIHKVTLTQNPHFIGANSYDSCLPLTCKISHKGVSTLYRFT